MQRSNRAPICRYQDTDLASENHQQIIDLVWLWFRSPHDEFAASGEADFWNRHTSVPIPKFALFCGVRSCELRNRRTLQLIDLVWLCSEVRMTSSRQAVKRTSEPPHRAEVRS